MKMRVLRAAIVRVRPGTHPAIRPRAGGFEISVDKRVFWIGPDIVHLVRGAADDMTRRLISSLRIAVGQGSKDRRTARTPDADRPPFHLAVTALSQRPALKARMGAEVVAKVKWSTPDRLAASDFHRKVALLMRKGRIISCLVVLEPDGQDGPAALAFCDALRTVPKVASRLHLARLTEDGQIKPLPTRALDEAVPQDELHKPAPDDDEPQGP